MATPTSPIAPERASGAISKNGAAVCMVFENLQSLCGIFCASATERQQNSTQTVILIEILFIIKNGEISNPKIGFIRTVQYKEIPTSFKQALWYKMMILIQSINRPIKG